MIANHRIASNGNSSASRDSLTQEIGTTSQRTRFGISQDDFLADWRTTQAKVLTVERMIKNNALIGGALRLAIEMSIRKVDWFFTSELGPDDPDLEFVNDAWNNLSHSWNDFISDAVLAPFYGWSTFTNKYERVNGRLLWRKFKYLQPDTIMDWLYDDDGGLLGLEQYPHLWPSPIPIERVLLIRFRHAGGNPEGESILRPAWTSFYYGAGLEEVRAIGYERHAAGMPLIRMPRGADGSDGSDDHNTAKEIARNIRVDEQNGVIVPPPDGPDDVDMWHVELMSAGNAQVFMALNSTISEYDQKVLVASLSQFVILGINGVGTQAKAETDVSFFTMAVDAFADTIAETFTKFAVARLLKLNGRQEGNIKLQHSPAGDVDSDMMIEFIKAVGGTMNWTPEDEKQLRSIFGMPDKSLEEIVSLTDEEDARAEERRQLIQQQLRGNDDEGAPEVDENALEIFAANNAPDDDERRRMERRWARSVLGYLKGAQKRVTNGARKL